MFYDRVKYRLTYNDIRIEIDEPKGWDDDAMSYSKHEKYHGISSSISNELEYFGYSFDVIVSAFKSEGLLANVVVEKSVRDEQTDEYISDYIGWCDFKTIQILDNSVKIKFNSNNKIETFKSINSTSLEYNTIKKLNGDTKLASKSRDIYLDGRPIENKSFLEMTEQTDYEYEMYFGGNNEREAYIPLNLRIYGTPDHDDVNNVIDGDGTLWVNDGSYQGVYRSFFSDAFADLTLNVDISVSINLKIYQGSRTRSCNYRLRLAVYNTDGNLVRIVPIMNDHGVLLDNIYEEFLPSSDNTSYTNIISFNRNISVVVPLEFGESLAIEHVVKARFGNFFYGSDLKIEFNNSELGYKNIGPNTANIDITEDSVYDETFAKFILVSDAMKMLSDTALNTQFNSNLLSIGEFKDLGLIHGFWLRGYTGSETKFKPITLSINEIFNNLNSITPIGLSIDNELRIENIEYFYQNFIFEDIGLIEDYLITIDNSFIKTSIVIGFNKAEIDEPDGSLDEFNSKTTFKTPLNGTSKDLKLLSKYRGDGDGMEKVRRNQVIIKDGSPNDIDESSGDDKTIWFIDTTFNIASNIYNTAKYGKYFAVAPTGIYAPETAINLRLSPANMLLRQGAIINTMLNNVKDKTLTYTSSEGNSKMKTQLIGGIPIMENEDINASNLKNKIHSGLSIQFKIAKKLKNINKFTNGIPNRYGLLAFNIDSNTKLYGYIKSIDNKENVNEIILNLKNYE